MLALEDYMQYTVYGVYGVYLHFHEHMLHFFMTTICSTVNSTITIY